MLAMPIYDWRYPGAYAYQTARTRLFDRVAINTVAEGASQVVILGAGYDTRAVRLNDHLSGVRVFELDLPATQRRKIDLIRQAEDRRWRHIQFIGTDFEAKQWAGELAAAGHDPSARTLVLWEGVAMFVAPTVVDETLAFVADCAPGSGVVFDYVVSQALITPEMFHGGAAVARYMRRGGEPWKFGLAHHEVAAFLQLRRLTLVDQWTPDELSRAFLSSSGTELEHPVLGFHGVAHAVADPAPTRSAA
jgi:methyltransferase (TIGR00027 family)